MKSVSSAPDVKDASSSLKPKSRFTDSKERHRAFVTDGLMLRRSNDSGISEQLLNRMAKESPESLFLDLLTACSLGRASMVTRLLKHIPLDLVSRFDTRNGEPTFGLTPLHRAKTVNITKLLVDFGVDVNICGVALQTPLHCSLNPDISAYLLKHGAQVDSETVDGSTPLHWAVQADYLPQVKTLVLAGADVNKQNHNGNSPMHLVDSVAVAQFLYDHGARLDLVNGHGKIPLEEAATKGNDEEHLRLASLLLDMANDEGLDFGMGSNSSSDPSSSGEDESTGDEEDVLEEMISIRPRNDSNLSKHSQSFDHDFSAIRNMLSHEAAQARWNKVRQRVMSGTISKTISKRGRNREKPQSRKFNSGSMSTVDSTIHGSEFYSSFFELMVRERPELAMKMLDKKRTFLYPKGSDKVYAYDLSLLGGPINSSSTLALIVDYERRDIISHEVVLWTIAIKWLLFTRETLHVEFFINCLFVMALMVTSLDRDQDILFNVTHNGMDEFLQVFTSWNRTSFILFGDLLVFGINMMYVMRHLIETVVRIGESKWSFWWFIYTPHVEEPFYIVPHVCIFIHQLVRALAQPTEVFYYHMSDVLAAFACALLWVRSLYFAEGYESIGVAMCTIRRMIKDIFVYILILFTFITGFSHALALIFRNSDSRVYGTMYNCWITLFFFIFNLDVGELDNENNEFRRYIGYLFVGLYMIVVAMVILNLIIATMTNTYDDIQENAKEQWMLTRAAMTIRHEFRERSRNRLYGLCLHDANNAALPELPKKVIVTEKPSGQVLVEVPAAWLHRLNLVRRRRALYAKFRYNVFWFWKSKIRRSPSFLWPTEAESDSFFSEPADANVSSRSLDEVSLDVLDETEADPLVRPDRPKPLGYNSISARQINESNRRLKKQFTSRDTNAARTGVSDELILVGQFYRNPKRIIAERANAVRIQEEQDDQIQAGLTPSPVGVPTVDSRSSYVTDLKSPFGHPMKRFRSSLKINTDVSEVRSPRARTVSEDHITSVHNDILAMNERILHLESMIADVLKHQKASAPK